MFASQRGGSISLSATSNPMPNCFRFACFDLSARAGQVAPFFFSLRLSPAIGCAGHLGFCGVALRLLSWRAEGQLERGRVEAWRETERGAAGGAVWAGGAFWGKWVWFHSLLLPPRPTAFLIVSVTVIVRTGAG